MIVLGPRDADLGGAPDYWREGFWRPDTLLRRPRICNFTSIPFDKCDRVMEYDARRAEAPSPEEQGWNFDGATPDIWRHDAENGVLEFRSEFQTPSIWRFDEDIETLPDRGAAYGLFLISEPAAEDREPGLDFIFRALPEEGRMRGMRACYSRLFHWRSLDSSEVRPLLRAAAEPEIEQVWHDFGMDAELTGAEIDLDDFDRDDGGKTIGSLDGIVTNEDRRIFLYAREDAPPLSAIFGFIEQGANMRGMIRNYVASFPGVFLRPAFRAFVPSERARLRLVFCRAPGDDDRDGGAIIQVRFATPSSGLRDNTLPQNAADPVELRFDGVPPGSLVEVEIPLEGLRAGEPLHFTVERDWRRDEDNLRNTVHLLSLILEEAQ
ncbi:hypothetical protein [Ruegeria jejuensis]|uniref:hypothetical protein n=1 Tax=Ruegeria jejuensis TaxID=3233338 RepID=UPI00355AD4F1